MLHENIVGFRFGLADDEIVVVGQLIECRLGAASRRLCQLQYLFIVSGLLAFGQAAQAQA